MSISTGGPHILLFERDQKLAALLVSELQLVGYEGHTARTAVEVFDAIARYPIRFVLVNLAQAAAARREFWVALDSQRRGNNMQVLTFHCTNLAGYGPRDIDERQVPLADMEVDGMLGLMALVNAVRARVPLADQTSVTVPRLNRVSTPSQSREPRYTQPLSNQAHRSGAQSTTQNYVGNNQSVPRQYQQPSISEIPAPSEKIRAVIYPHQQRVWNAPMAKTPETDIPLAPKVQAAPISQPTRSVMPPSDTPVLQRLANGDLSDESGLAQLTRLVQESQAQPVQMQSVQPVIQTQADESHVSMMTTVVSHGSSVITQQQNWGSQIGDTSLPLNYVSPSARPNIASEAISLQPLRLAPIQELPDERPITVHHNPDGQKRPDVLSRANYNPQSTAPQPPVAIQPPLASIAPSSPSVKKEDFEGVNRSAVPSSTSPNTQQSAKAPQTTKDENSAHPQSTRTAATRKEREGEFSVTIEKKEKTGEELQEEQKREEKRQDLLVEEKKEQKNIVYEFIRNNQQAHDEILLEEALSEDETAFAKNSIILDILKSLPPMPALGNSQSIQPQVLNGKATRSLKHVLLEGHLVPQDRLEVAQNIQRMLRGVDLNYQLGEILLMFKLLTPDQLLAASLVSYGAITTAQVSSFGRIRQELHSIGLEYDLENLLILFRVLTPEQLREVRAHIEI